STQKFIDETGELRVISGRMLGATGVQIPKNILDNLYSSREVDGTSETMEPRDLFVSLLLADPDLSILYSLIGTLVLDFLGGKLSTSASGSQPSDNTKKDRIQQPPSSTQKNKVEAYLKTIKSSLKNKNYVVEPKGTTIVGHSKLNANSELICVNSNGCMLSDNHDLYVLNVINDVIARPKFKYVKKTSKRKIWKPSGKEQSLIIATLKDELRKLKRKALVDNIVTAHTIDLEMLKIDMEPLAPRLLNNRTAYSDYLRLT
nr:hypothetical protein [Tanacetum cinerariifolium]